MSSNPTNARLEWSEIFPWAIVLRSLTTSFSIAVLVFAMIGVVATPMGWIVSEKLFISSEEFLNDNPVLAELVEINRSPYRGVFQATKKNNTGRLNLLGVDLSGPQLVFEQIVKPFYAIFGGATSTREFLYYALGSIWTLAVWSFAGLGIARVSLLRYTRNERAGLDDAFEYATEYFSTSFSALVLPFGLVLLLCVPTFLIGLVLGFDLGVLVVGFFWFVVLGLSLLLGILLLGLMVSWPLVVCSVAAEGQNSFDAITRAFAYAFQRPVHYFCYALIAVVFGGICWLMVVQFTESVVRLSFWSTAWGANRIVENRIDDVKGEVSSYSDFFLKSRMISQFQDTTNALPADGNRQIQQSAENQNATTPFRTLKSEIPTQSLDESTEVPGQPSSNLIAGQKLIRFWTGFARTVASAFIHGLFWCMASAVYLLLRKDVDQTAMDEIFLIDERRTYDLPPLKSDENGIPQVQPLPMDEDD